MERRADDLLEPVETTFAIEEQGVRAGKLGALWRVVDHEVDELRAVGDVAGDDLRPHHGGTGVADVGRPEVQQAVAHLEEGDRCAPTFGGRGWRDVLVHGGGDRRGGGHPEAEARAGGETDERRDARGQRTTRRPPPGRRRRRAGRPAEQGRPSIGERLEAGGELGCHVPGEPRRDDHAPRAEEAGADEGAVRQLLLAGSGGEHERRQRRPPPGEDDARRRTVAPRPGRRARGSVTRQMSSTICFGRTRLRNGTNQAPTPQPGVNRSSQMPSANRLWYIRPVQIAERDVDAEPAQRGDEPEPDRELTDPAPVARAPVLEGERRARPSPRTGRPPARPGSAASAPS